MDSKDGSPTVKTKDSEPIMYAAEPSKAPQKSTVPAFGPYSAPEPYQESAHPDGISTKQDKDSTPSPEGKRDGVELMFQLQQNQIQMKLQSEQAAAERMHFDQQRAAYEQRLSTFETEKQATALREAQARADLNKLQEQMVLLMQQSLHGRPGSSRGSSRRDSGNDESDASDSEDESHSRRGSKTPKSLSTSEINSVKENGQLEPALISEWATDAIDTLTKYATMWATAVEEAIDTGDHIDFWEAYAASKQLRVQDMYMAGVIKSALDNKSIHVQNFTTERNRIHKTESDEQRIVELCDDEMMIPKINKSGFRIWLLIINIPRKHAGALVFFTLEQFNAKPYLTMNMTSAEFISVTNRMIQDYELVPESEKPAGKYAIQKMIISKIPDANERARFNRKLTERITDGEIDKIWSVTQLIRKIAPTVCTSTTEPTINAGNWKGGGKGGKGKGKGGKGGKGGRDGSQVTCALCGKSGHRPNEKDENDKRICKAVCATCGDTTFCIGCRAPYVCITVFDKMPAKNTLTIGGGNTMPKFVHDQLSELFPKLKQKVAGATLRSAELADDATQTPQVGTMQAAGFSMFMMSAHGDGHGKATIHVDGYGKSELTSTLLTMATARHLLTTRPAPMQGCVLSQIDGGADCCMTNDVKLLNVATSVSWNKVVIKAAGGSRPSFDATIWVPFKLGSSKVVVPIFFYYRKKDEPIETIISETYLELQGLTFKKSPDFEIKWQGGEVQPLIPVKSGYAYLTFAQMELYADSRGSINAMKAPSAESQAINIAATFNLSSTDIIKLASVAKGIPKLKISADVAALIDNNSVRQRALEKRGGVKAQKAPKDKTLIPGHTWEMDVWIPSTGTKCPLSGATCQIEAIDICSSVLRLANAKRHTAEELLSHARSMAASEAALMPPHTIRVIKIDNEASARSPQGVISALGQGLAKLTPPIELLVGAGDHHEFIGKMEVTGGNVIERRAEMQMMRANATNPGDLFSSRMHVAWLHTRGPISTSAISPYQHHTGTAFDFSTFENRGGVPVWHAKVSYLLIETERSDKGTNECRSAEGTFVGFTPVNGYIIKTANGSQATRQKVTPLNNQALARVGLPAGGATVEVKTQITSQNAPPLTLMAQPAPILKVEKVYVPIVNVQEVPIGTMLKVWWRDTKGGGEWYIGKVQNISVDPTTKVIMHEIVYEGYENRGTLEHNLAKERENGSFPWFIVRKPATKDSTSVTTPVIDPASRTSGRVKQRPNYHGMIASQLERTTNPISFFNCAAFAIAGDGSDQFEVTSIDQIDDALDRLAQFTSDESPECTANKATQKHVDIMTPMGTETMYVPQTDDEVAHVKDSDEWMVADTKAVEVGLLSFGENRKEPYSYIKEHELIVYDAQMARRLKVENGKLAKRDARKSRVSINWVKHKRTNKHKVRYEPSPTYSTSADPFTKKACIALATAGKYTKVKGDVSGAFRQVITPRGERAIRMPKHLRTYNSNGEEEYIVVNTSVEGEPFSGYEWDTKFLNDRLEIGWKLVPGVPGMMVYKDCVMIGEVDDFMILEPSENRMKLSALTIHLLSQRYTAIDGAPAIKVDPEPEIYAGVEMATSMERDRCTLRTDQKIREAARAHVPAVVDKDVTGIKDLNLLKGTALSKALENLALAPLPPGVKANEIKLTEQQKCMMQLAGSLRFPAEYTPALELPLCKISRVVARAPEGAYRVGQSVVASFYKEIETKKGKGITYQAGKDAPRMQVAMKGEARYIDDGKDVEYKGQSGVKLKDGAAARLETFADATWGKLEELEPSYFDQDGVLTKEAFEQVVRESPKDIYGILVTLAGASVAAKSKALKIITSCSMDAERHASTKVSELAELGRLIERAFGYDMSMPTLLATDNLPHLRVTQGEASASRSRHLLRRYLQIRQSMQAGDVKTRFVSDVENPSDFLTKFLDRIKLEASLEYVTNSKNAVDETPKELIAQSKEWYAQAIANACKMDERAAMDSPTFSAKVANLDGDIIEESQLEAVYSAALARAYSAMQA